MVMVAKKKPVKKVYGPYKGSEENGGRKIYVIKRGQKATSTNAARLDYKRATGKSLSKNTHVDHKDNNHKNGKVSNLKAMSASKNIGKGNKNRKKK
jgi:hypothetical protein